MAKKPTQKSEGKRKQKQKKKKNMDQRKIKKNTKEHKQTTIQKRSTTTEDIIPTYEQQHIKEKLTSRNTRYIQIGPNNQEHSPPPSIKKKHFPNENIIKRISL